MRIWKNCLTLCICPGRPPGGGHGNTLQFSCLENPTDRGAWWAAVQRVAKSWTWLKPLSMHPMYCGPYEVNSLSHVQLCNPMDCSPPGSSSVYGIFQARTLEWVAIFFSRGSSRPRDQTQVSHIAGRLFTFWATRESHGPYRKCKLEKNHAKIWSGISKWGGEVVKNPPANPGDRRWFDPWLRKIPGEGNGNMLRYSCLGNPMDRGAWHVIVHGVTKSRTQLSTHPDRCIYWDLNIFCSRQANWYLKSPGDLLEVRQHFSVG